MLSRHTRLITCACFVLALLLTVPGLAYARTVQLNDVLDSKVNGLRATVFGHGGWSGKCMTGAFENNTGEEIIVTIPVGLKLVPPEGSEGVQTMICSGYETLVIPAGESEHQFTAFCGEKDDGSPGGTSGFSSGGLASKEMIRLLERINDAGLFDSDAQAAVWSLTDGLDISENPAAQQYLTDNKVPAGKAALAGLGAGLTGAALAEAMRRIIGMGPPLTKAELMKDPELARKFEELERKAKEARDKEDQEQFDELLEFGEDDDDSSSKESGKKGDRKDAKKPEKKSEPKVKPQLKPQQQAPKKASGEQSKFKWDRKNKKVVITSPGSHMEIGKKDFYISPHAPGANPFKFKPPTGFDVEDGKTKLSKSGSGYSLDTPSGDKKQPWNLYHESKSGYSRVQKGFFVLDQQGQKWGVEDLIQGKKTGLVYDGSKKDFRAFRDNFSAYRKGKWVGVSETPAGGKPIKVEYKTGSQPGFAGSIGDRWLKADGDVYGYGWGSGSKVQWNAGGGRGTVAFDTHGGDGVTSVTGGRDGQFGFSRTQPVEINNQNLQLSVAFSRYLRDNAGSGVTDDKWRVGLGGGNVRVQYDSAKKFGGVAYGFKFGRGR